MITMKINYTGDNWYTNYRRLKEVEDFLYSENIKFGYKSYHDTLPEEMYIENNEVASLIKLRFNV